MTPKIQSEIDALLQKIGEINDLNMKFDTLTYIEQQAGFMLWQLEEDMHVDQNMKNI